MSLYLYSRFRGFDAWHWEDEPMSKTKMKKLQSELLVLRRKFRPGAAASMLQLVLFCRTCLYRFARFKFYKRLVLF